MVLSVHAHCLLNYATGIHSHHRCMWGHFICLGIDRRTRNETVTHSCRHKVCFLTLRSDSSWYTELFVQNLDWVVLHFLLWGRSGFPPLQRLLRHKVAGLLSVLSPWLWYGKINDFMCDASRQKYLKTLLALAACAHLLSNSPWICKPVSLWVSALQMQWK